MLNHCSTVRMTSSLAERMFRTATPITTAELTEQHLDMLQCDAATSIELRLELGDASDALRAGDRGAAVVQRVVDAYNARAGRSAPRPTLARLSPAIVVQRKP